MKQKQPQKTISAEGKRLALLLLVNSVLFVALYFVLANAGFDYVFLIYTVLAALLFFVFLIYNRGFSARNVTPEMLPESMSLEEKKAFIEDGKRRFSASRWILAFLFPLVLAIAIDVMYLFLFPMLKEMFQ